MTDHPVRVQHLQIFPIKSLDPHIISEAHFLPAGPIENDRRWALFDEDDKIVNAKRFPALQQIRSQFNDDFTELNVQFQTESDEPVAHPFRWPDEEAKFSAAVSEYLDKPMTLRESSSSCFPDDREATGPTLIGTATLRELTNWFPEIPYEEFRRRFRANIELETDEPFWEDRLFATADSARSFRIGETPFLGINPCQRCAVPARDSYSGETTTGFQKRFMQLREQHLPEYAEREQFNHYYRLAVNTKLASAVEGQSIRVGDLLKLE